VNANFFQDQVKRLHVRFGERNFDAEFVSLLWDEVCTMSDPGLKMTVDVMIGNRLTNKPPVLQDFRDARLKEEKLKFENEVRGASRAVFEPTKNGGLQKFLSLNYPGCRTLWSAVEAQIKRNKAARGEVAKPDGEPEGAA
jgi:hypothetical protein